jgi:hypothetical protein
MKNRIEWQYNGVAPWKDIVDWCYATFGRMRDAGWSCNWETFYFDNEQVYTLFLLKWT